MPRKTRQSKEPRSGQYRISVMDEGTHKELKIMRFSTLSLSSIILTVFAVILAGCFLLISYTPIRSLIPGYPDAVTRRDAMDNAIRLDSLEGVVSRWEFYAENLRRVVEGEDPVRIDSLIRSNPSAQIVSANAEELRRRDSLLRRTVLEEEEFGLTSKKRELPIEGVQFFTPLKGSVYQGFQPVIHPYIDILAPSGSVVMSVLDGTVVYSGYTDENGYSLAIQHDSGIISVYMHNQKLLKKTGDKVFAGSIGTDGRKQPESLEFAIFLDKSTAFSELVCQDVRAQE